MRRVPATGLDGTLGKDETRWLQLPRRLQMA